MYTSQDRVKCVNTLPPPLIIGAESAILDARRSFSMIFSQFLNCCGRAMSNTAVSLGWKQPNAENGYGTMQSVPSRCRFIHWDRWYIWYRLCGDKRCGSLRSCKAPCKQKCPDTITNAGNPKVKNSYYPVRDYTSKSTLDHAAIFSVGLHAYPEQLSESGKRGSAPAKFERQDLLHSIGWWPPWLCYSWNGVGISALCGLSNQEFQELQIFSCWTWFIRGRATETFTMVAMRNLVPSAIFL